MWHVFIRKYLKYFFHDIYDILSDLFTNEQKHIPTKPTAKIPTFVKQKTNVKQLRLS